MNHTKNARNTILVDVLHTGHSPPDLALRTRGAEAHVSARHKDVRARAIDMQTTQSWFSLSMLKNKVVGDKYVYVK